jgi:hypothetical protein
MPEEWVMRVAKIAQHKYEIDGDILDEYIQDLELCWENGFTPIRTVEYIAEKLFA